MEELIEFLKKEFHEGIQMFDTRNLVGDSMCTIYDKNGIVVGYCFMWEYIEIFGLTDEQFEHIENVINPY